jgi:hypothetical protein
MTTAEFIRRTGLPAQFGIEMAPSLIEHYLWLFQGKLGAEVVDPRPILWSTPSSPLRSGVWYPAVARWEKAPPNENVLEHRLKAEGFSLFRVRGADDVKLVGKNTLAFVVNTGTKPVVPDDIRKAIGAVSVVINLDGAMDNPNLTWIDDLAEQGEDVIANIDDAIKSLANGIKKASKIPAKAFDFIGWLIEWGPMIVVGGAAAYFGNKAYKAYKKTRPRKVAA